MPSRPRLFLVVRSPANVAYVEALDLNSLVHDVAFSAVCEDRLENNGRWEPIGVEPHRAHGACTGVTVSVSGAHATYDRSVFSDRAVEVLRTKGVLEGAWLEGPLEVSWDIEADHPLDEVDQGRRTPSIRHRAYPIVRRDLVELDAPDRPATGTGLSVLVADRLLAELRDEAAASLDRERADFLVGQLVRDPEGRIAVVLRARIPAATDTAGSLVHFAFSPRTFQAAQRELERQGTGDVILGWHHNHPPPCGHACLMTLPACQTDNVAFSLDDRVVHRSAFGQPYMVALVSGKGASQRADDPLMRAYGWHRGLICERGWQAFQGDRHD